VHWFFSFIEIKKDYIIIDKLFSDFFFQCKKVSVYYLDRIDKNLPFYYLLIRKRNRKKEEKKRLIDREEDNIDS